MSETTQNKMSTLLPAPPPEVNPWSQRPASIKPVASAIQSNVKTPPIKKELWPSADQSAKENVREITKDSAAAPPVVKRGKEKWVPLKANIAIASPTAPKKGSNKSKGKKSGTSNNHTKSDSTTKKKNSKKPRKPKEEDESKLEENPIEEEGEREEESDTITSAVQEIAVAAEETVEPPSETNTETFAESESTTGQPASPPEQAAAPAIDIAIVPGNGSASGRRGTYSNSNGQRHHGYRNNSAANNNNGSFRRSSHSPSYGIPAIPQPYMGGMLPGAPFIPMSPYAASPAAFQYPQFVPIPAPGPKPKRGSRSNTESPSPTSSASSPTPENIAMVPPQQFGIPPMNYVDPSMYMSPYAANPYLQMYPAAPFVNDRVSQLGQQINYYFSTENLIKDFYLRKHMNSEGYVRVQFIEDFSRVKNLANGDHNLVVQAIRQNPQLELAGSGKDKKVRRKTEWENWVLPKEQRDPSVKAD